MPQLPSPRPWPHSLKWWVYGLVRPVARPVGRRVRMFLVGSLEDEVAALRADIQGLREAIERERAAEKVAVEERIGAVMAQALATLALDRERAD